MLATLAASDWDRAKASLLLQRAGFGGTPDEVAALAALSPAEAAESLLGPSRLVAPEPPAFLSEPDLKETLQSERSKLAALPEKARAEAKKEFAQFAKTNQRRHLT